MAGKGDTYRKVDRDKFNKNYDRVFGRCSKHPTYSGKIAPKIDCIVCRRIFREQSFLKGNCNDS